MHAYNHDRAWDGGVKRTRMAKERQAIDEQLSEHTPHTHPKRHKKRTKRERITDWNQWLNRRGVRSHNGFDGLYTHMPTYMEFFFSVPKGEGDFVLYEEIPSTHSIEPDLVEIYRVPADGEKYRFRLKSVDGYYRRIVTINGQIFSRRFRTAATLESLNSGLIYAYPPYYWIE